VTKMRKDFETRLAQWAKRNGYVLRGYLWCAENDYITCKRESSSGPFVAHRTEYKTGRELAAVDLAA